MPPQDYHLRYLDAAAAELKTYLLSNELYWPLRLRLPSGEPDYPPMTPGNLLLFRTKLQGRWESGSLKSADKTILLGLEEQLDALIQAWRTAWESKVAREFKSRVDQWKNNLAELSDDHGNRTEYYKTDVRVRVLLELLAGEFRGHAPAQLSLLPALDQKLRIMTKDAEFLWEEELEGVFGREKYWFLYRLIR
jgi:uncharacterized protein YukE